MLLGVGKVTFFSTYTSWTGKQTNMFKRKYNIKGKVVTVHAWQAYGGSRSTAPLILNLGTRPHLVANFRPWQLYPQE